MFTKVQDKFQQATASDLPFYDNFAQYEFPVLKNFDNVIASELWFGPPPPIKNPGYAYAPHHWQPRVFELP